MENGKLRATSIEEALDIIDFYILKFKKEHNPLGYFTAVYRLTTLKVKEVCNECDDVEFLRQNSIENKGVKDDRKYHDWVDHDHGEHHFDDPVLMRKMVVQFANRYFEALEHLCNKDIDKIRGPWAVAFEAGSKKGLISAQHFALSANAHINLDLAIAAAQVCHDNGKSISDFEDDFNTMNDVLASLYEQMNDCVALIWPWFGKMAYKFSKIIWKLEDKSMEYLRTESWINAEKYFGYLESGDRNSFDQLVEENEKITAKLGAFMAAPGIIPRMFIWSASKTERYSMGLRISLFENSRFIDTE